MPSSTAAPLLPLVLLLAVAARMLPRTTAFVVPSTPTIHPHQRLLATQNDGETTIVSPFDESGAAGTEKSSSTTTTTTSDYLELTWDNVDAVLDELRPFLIQDGGNVIIQEIDGPVVRLELQGNCGSCPSSTQTMKMGLERGLKEKIPEIQEVIQANPQGPAVTDEQVELVLDGVRPFLDVAGGSIAIDRMEDLDGLQPTIWLDMQGSSASLSSVKLEIAQRLQRHFMQPGLRVEWIA